MTIQNSKIQWSRNLDLTPNNMHHDQKWCFNRSTWFKDLSVGKYIFLHDFFDDKCNRPISRWSGSILLSRTKAGHSRHVELYNTARLIILHGNEFLVLSAITSDILTWFPRNVSLCVRFIRYRRSEMFNLFYLIVTFDTTRVFYGTTIWLILVLSRLRPRIIILQRKS